MTDRQSTFWAAAGLLLSIEAALVVILRVEGPVRLVIVLVFLTTAPGLAIFRRLGLPFEPALAVCVIVSTSLAIAAGVAMALLYARAWSLDVAILLLTALVAALSIPDVASIQASVAHAWGRFIRALKSAFA